MSIVLIVVVIISTWYKELWLLSNTRPYQILSIIVSWSVMSQKCLLVSLFVVFAGDVPDFY
mgnify:CR=1 FL=1